MKLLFPRLDLLSVKMVYCTFIILYIYASHLVSKAQTQNACSGANYARHINRRLRCGIFKTLPLNWVDCPKQCTSTLQCFSVNTYRSQQGKEICELVRGTKDSFQDEGCLEMKDGSEHFELMVGTKPLYQSSSFLMGTRKQLE